MIALAVFITLTICMIVPLLVVKPRPLTEREVAFIEECNTWAAEAKAKLDAIQAKSDALTAQAATPVTAPVVAATQPGVHTLARMVRLATDDTTPPAVKEWARGQGRYALAVWTLMRTDIKEVL